MEEKSNDDQKEDEWDRPKQGVGEIGWSLEDWLQGGRIGP